MAKIQSPLLGYNNNVRHRGRLFHIQTEDSGVNHPHIITHVFMDGGRILKSQKRSYAEHVGSDGLSETVKELMKEQHKAMFIALRDGQFDALVEGAGGGAPAAKAPAPKAPAPPPPTLVDPQEIAGAGAGADAPVVPPPPTEPELPRIDEPDSEATEVRAAEIPPSERPAAAAPPEAAPLTTPEKRRPSVEELTLDFDAFERDTLVGLHTVRDANGLPPPPKNLFAKPASSTYRAVGSADPTRPTHPTRPTSAAPKSPSQRPARPSTEGRYAPARPAAIFGAAPKTHAASIFGDEVIGDKSLDEVILSYLAEDLDPRSD